MQFNLHYSINITSTLSGRVLDNVHFVNIRKAVIYTEQWNEQHGESVRWRSTGLLNLEWIPAWLTMSKTSLIFVSVTYFQIKNGYRMTGTDTKRATGIIHLSWWIQQMIRQKHTSNPIAIKTLRSLFTSNNVFYDMIGLWVLLVDDQSIFFNVKARYWMHRMLTFDAYWHKFGSGQIQIRRQY